MSADTIADLTSCACIFVIFWMLWAAIVAWQKRVKREGEQESCRKN